MRSIDNLNPLHSSRRASNETRNTDDAVVSNERMTALAGAILLALFVIELMTAALLRTMLTIHVFVGVLLVGPLAVKIGSTGYRFLRYYTGSPAFVRRGPPRMQLRILAPLLLITTLVVVGSGIGLLVTGPAQPGSLLFLHGVSSLMWLPLVAIHTFAYIWKVPRLIREDWSKRSPTEQVGGNALRLGVNLGMLVASAIAAVLVLPAATPWVAWSQVSVHIPGPLVVGVILAALALLATRPHRWQ
jgi:hypothetical protein